MSQTWSNHRSNRVESWVEQGRIVSRIMNQTGSNHIMSRTGSNHESNKV